MTGLFLYNLINGTRPKHILPLRTKLKKLKNGVSFVQWDQTVLKNSVDPKWVKKFNSAVGISPRKGTFAGLIDKQYKAKTLRILKSGTLPTSFWKSVEHIKISQAVEFVPPDPIKDEQQFNALMVAALFGFGAEIMFNRRVLGAMSTRLEGSTGQTGPGSLDFASVVIEVLPPFLRHLKLLSVGTRVLPGSTGKPMKVVFGSNTTKNRLNMSYVKRYASLLKKLTLKPIA